MTTLHARPAVSQCVSTKAPDCVVPCDPRGIIAHVDRFLEWIGLKQKLHQGTQSPPLVTAGDIWWASVGQNVGSEVNGKSHALLPPSDHL